MYQCALAGLAGAKEKDGFVLESLLEVENPLIHIGSYIAEFHEIWQDSCQIASAPLEPYTPPNP